MIFLSKEDICKIVSLKELLQSITKAFKLYSTKAFTMPDRIHIHKQEDTLLYMPCFTDSIFGTKIISVFPNNNRYNTAAIQGIMLMNDIKTGKPLAVLDGATLTAYRTGAVGGVGIDLTASKTCESVGLIGAGVQGYYQLLFACEVRNIKNIYVHDLYPQKLKEFCYTLQKQLPNVNINICSNVEDLLLGSQIVITATNANEPVLPNKQELLKDKHIIAIGSYKPNMRELPEALFKQLNTVYVDTEFSIQESGDLITPLQKGWISLKQVETLDKLLTSPKKLSNTTLFKSVGMALFDIVVAEYLYNKALSKDLGQKVHF